MRTFLPSSLARPIAKLLAVLAVVLVGAPIAAANPAVVDTHEPISGAETNPCTGEPFVFAGFMHSKVTLMLDGSGAFHFTVEASWQDVKGVTVSGAKYVVPFASSGHLYEADVAPVTMGFTFTEQFVRVGDDGALVTGDDFVMTSRIHLTVNANGVTTVDRFESDMRCK